MRLVKSGLLSVAIILGLAACEEIVPPPPGGGAPTISSFTASPNPIQSGGSSMLSWEVSGATSLSISPDVGTVTGQSSVSVSPMTTTDYTLTATNANDSVQDTTTVTVSDGNGGGGNGEAPQGTFGVSISPSGPFSNDLGEGITDPSDIRAISVSAGSSFYAQVDYADPDGITGATIRLVNSSPEGLSGDLSTDADVGGFTLVGEPTGDCDFASAPTSVTCVHEISVASGTVNIDELEEAGNEFAYVFRTYVTDTAGNTSAQPIRGYVLID